MSSRSPHVGLGPALLRLESGDAWSLGVVCQQRATTSSGQRAAPTRSPICRLPSAEVPMRKAEVEETC